jgi:Holliday junction resolvasome RuvABC endonuclease subunit
MKISVLGMDPSLRNWGLASSYLDLITGFLDDPILSLVLPKDMQGKQVRVNSNDLHLAEQLARPVIEAAQKAKVIFVEVPVGSQSSRAMASYGVCVGVLGAVRALGIPLIEVTAAEVKLALAGTKNATKQQQIDAAVAAYPASNWTTMYDGQQKGKIPQAAEHCADGIGAIHAGVRTSTFQNLMRLYAQT